MATNAMTERQPLTEFDPNNENTVGCSERIVQLTILTLPAICRAWHIRTL
jgi:hypothetical protein